MQTIHNFLLVISLCKKLFSCLLSLVSVRNQNLYSIWFHQSGVTVCKFHTSLCVYSVEPEGPQEEVSVTPEPQPEPEAELEPEPAAVELKPEPVSEPEVHIEEKIQRSPPSPTPADTTPAMQGDNRVRPPSFITVCWVSLVSINVHLWRCAVITNRISEITCEVKCVLFQPSSWASVTSKNLPPGGVVPATGVPPHVVRVPSAQVDVHNQRFHF